ncbi:hypothetical protein [Oceaniglobus ichthyenteri]|uniref:hypothetical protein n=1 Tax=Oceaniglobus ichthyenteri TaxID=2136177 RepID=UPI000D386059|nr:hypothetical protein [Oceaniglobus ichthyenteri]
MLGLEQIRRDTKSNINRRLINLAYQIETSLESAPHGPALCICIPDPLGQYCAKLLKGNFTMLLSRYSPYPFSPSKGNSCDPLGSAKGATDMIILIPEGQLGTRKRIVWQTERGACAFDHSTVQMAQIG